MAVQGLPPVPAAALPRDIREGSMSDREAYEAALGFERMLVAKLVETAMPERQGGDASSPYTTAVTGAFADGLMTAGGLGLARQIHARIAGNRA
jgi:hypothetical protein